MFERVEQTAQSILELTSLIEVAPYTSMWYVISTWEVIQAHTVVLHRMLIGIPMTSFFVLFDLVIHNPRQQQAASNLALLDIAAAHASQLDYVSEGAIPGSVIGEFVHIVRTYVSEVNGLSVAGDTTQQPLPHTGQVLFSQPHWSLPHDEIEEFAAMDVAADFSEVCRWFSTMLKNTPC